MRQHIFCLFIISSSAFSSSFYQKLEKGGEAFIKGCTRSRCPATTEQRLDYIQYLAKEAQEGKQPIPLHQGLAYGPEYLSGQTALFIMRTGIQLMWQDHCLIGKRKKLAKDIIAFFQGQDEKKYGDYFQLYMSVGIIKILFPKGYQSRIDWKQKPALPSLSLERRSMLARKIKEIDAGAYKKLSINVPLRCPSIKVPPTLNLWANAFKPFFDKQEYISEAFLKSLWLYPEQHGHFLKELKDSLQTTDTPDHILIFQYTLTCTLLENRFNLNGDLNYQLSEHFLRKKIGYARSTMDIARICKEQRELYAKYLLNAQENKVSSWVSNVQGYIEEGKTTKNKKFARIIVGHPEWRTDTEIDPNLFKLDRTTYPFVNHYGAIVFPKMLSALYLEKANFSCRKLALYMYAHLSLFQGQWIKKEGGQEEPIHFPHRADDYAKYVNMYNNKETTIEELNMILDDLYAPVS